MGITVLRALLAVALLLIVAGCEPEPTPFPVELPPTPTPTLAPEALPPLRYALAPNTGGVIPDLNLVQASASIIAVNAVNEADLGTQYDFIVQYGESDGWTRAPITPQIALAISDRVRPEFAGLVRAALDPQAIVSAVNISGAVVSDATLTPMPARALREQLANAGYPDGVALTIAVPPVVGAVALLEQIAAAGFVVQPLVLQASELGAAFDDGQADMVLFVYGIESERALWESRITGGGALIDLYTLPISYRAADGVAVTFSPRGYPLVNR